MKGINFMIALIIVALIILLVNVFKNKPPKIGDQYIHCFEFDNPFKESSSIDTVEVVAIKDGYVQYKLKNGGKSSCSIRLFNRITKKIEE